MEEINIRFKALRKACHKNQTDFGKVLGISSSGVANIETGQRKVSERHLLMLSNWTEYNVNIDWLRTGNGEMFLPTETNILEKIRNEYNLTEKQFKFVSSFLRLPENEKNIIFDFLSSVFNDNFNTSEEKIQQRLELYNEGLGINHPATPEELEKEYPPIDTNELGKKSEVG